MIEVLGVEMLTAQATLVYLIPFSVYSSSMTTSVVGLSCVVDLLLVAFAFVTLYFHFSCLEQSSYDLDLYFVNAVCFLEDVDVPIFCCLDEILLKAHCIIPDNE